MKMRYPKSVSQMGQKSWNVERKSRPRLKGRFIILVFCFIAFFSSINRQHGQAKQPLDDLFGVTFPSSEHGWVCGRWGAIFHTTDGGTTWNRQKSGTELTLSAICFVDDTHGWTVGDEGTILHTSDGGNTWLSKKSPVPFFLLDVQFIDKQTGWIVTERTTILHTTDGGRSWAIQFQDQDYMLKAISFCDSMHGWAVGEYGFIYHTADGGTTWEHQAGRFDWDEETGEIIGGNYLFDVVAMDPSNAWAVGIDGYVSRTIDGGKTWERVTTTIPATHLLGITAGKKGGILICGESALFVSADGGRTFSQRSEDPVITYGWLNNATVAPDGRMIAAGKEGWVYMSSDDGKFWQSIVTQ